MPSCYTITNLLHTNQHTWLTYCKAQQPQQELLRFDTSKSARYYSQGNCSTNGTRTTFCSHQLYQPWLLLNKWHKNNILQPSTLSLLIPQLSVIESNHLLLGMFPWMNSLLVCHQNDTNFTKAALDVRFFQSMYWVIWPFFGACDEPTWQEPNQLT